MTNDFSKLVRCSESKNALWIVLETEIFGTSTLQFSLWYILTSVCMVLHGTSYFSFFYWQQFFAVVSSGFSVKVANSNLAHWMETLAIIATYSNREYQALLNDEIRFPIQGFSDRFGFFLKPQRIVFSWGFVWAACWALGEGEIWHPLSSGAPWDLIGFDFFQILICDTLLFHVFHFKCFVFTLEVSCFVIDPRGVQICYICAKNFPKTVSIWANTHVASQAGKYANINEIRIWCTWLTWHDSELNFQGSQKLALQDLAADLEHVCFFVIIMSSCFFSFQPLIFASVHVVHVCACQILSFSGHPSLSTFYIFCRFTKFKVEKMAVLQDATKFSQAESAGLRHFLVTHVLEGLLQMIKYFYIFFDSVSVFSRQIHSFHRNWRSAPAGVESLGD